jgi:hypothetical protein
VLLGLGDRRATPFAASQLGEILLLNINRTKRKLYCNKVLLSHISNLLSTFAGHQESNCILNRIPVAHNDLRLRSRVVIKKLYKLDIFV